MYSFFVTTPLSHEAFQYFYDAPLVQLRYSGLDRSHIRCESMFQDDNEVSSPCDVRGYRSLWPAVEKI